MSDFWKTWGHIALGLFWILVVGGMVFGLGSLIYGEGYRAGVARAEGISQGQIRIVVDEADKHSVSVTKQFGDTNLTTTDHRSNGSAARLLMARDSGEEVYVISRFTREWLNVTDSTGTTWMSIESFVHKLREDKSGKEKDKGTCPGDCCKGCDCPYPSCPKKPTR